MLISILLRQIAIMALLAAVGVYLSRKGFLSPQGTKDLGAILLRVIIPCVIVKSYITEFSRERLLELALSAGLTLIGFILAMVISYLVFGKRRRLENFAASFCNAGFIGIPLAQAIIGEEGVFYIAASVGANICVFAQQYDCDYEFSVVTVCLSTLLSVITVPLLVSFAQMIL